jgi:hypothetical protein
MPTRLKIQYAVTQILSAYLRSHPLPHDQIPNLMTVVGQALSYSLTPPIPQSPQRKTHRGPDRHPRVRRSRSVVVNAEPVGEDQGEITSLSTVEEPMPEVEPEGDLRVKRIARRRARLEAQAEILIEDGVRVTRLPEVTGRRI